MSIRVLRGFAMFLVMSGYFAELLLPVIDGALWQQIVAGMSGIAVGAGLLILWRMLDL